VRRLDAAWNKEEQTMGTTLITGVSGLIGKALAESLAKTRDVVGMSRKDPGAGFPFVPGDFGREEDLRKLDGFDLDAVVHLAAVTGGCSERDGMMVNVEGTRCLMRHLIDRGVKKFVMASSIAVVGLQDKDFLPQALPMPDEHPCLDRHGYGFSKFLMEEVMKYHVRQTPDLDAIAFRLSVVTPRDGMPPKMKVCDRMDWGLGAMTVMPLEEALTLFTAGLDAPPKPGMRILNAVPAEAWAADPVADILEHWYGDAVDLSHYRQPGRERDSVFARGRLAEELGLVLRAE
jgi:nucleoside-diphosphate-sugar epimerase